MALWKMTQKATLNLVHELWPHRFSIMFKQKLPLIVIICFFFEFSLWGGQEQPPASRPASIDEIRQLFSLAIAQPPKRIRFVADIKIIQPSWTEGQIDDELKEINNFMKSRDRRFSQDERANLNSFNPMLSSKHIPESMFCI